MNWEQQIYGYVGAKQDNPCRLSPAKTKFRSFGYPNAQPPTPTRTPTSSIFPSPIFQTPIENNDLYTGWTPKFVEEFSPYTSTPGGIAGISQSSFVQSTRPTTAPTTNSGHFTQQDTLVHHSTIPAHRLPIQAVETTLPPASSPGQGVIGQAVQVQDAPRTTPQHAPHRIQTVFSQQTATPPQSGNDANVTSTPMQGSDNNLNLFSTPGQQTMLDFSNMTDSFACSLNAPQTAPAMPSFWNTDTGMNAMTMRFSNTPTTLTDVPLQRAGSTQWNSQHPSYQQCMTIPQFNAPSLPQSQNIQSTQNLSSSHLLPLDSHTPTSFGFVNSASDDPFSASVPKGAVEPGMVFSYPSGLNAVHNTRQTHNLVSPTRLIQSQDVQQPSSTASRPQPHGLLRSQSTRELNSAMVPKTFMSPVKGVRNDLRRSMSDCKIKQADLNTLNNLASGQGRMSPVKQLGRSPLAPIPEVQSKPKVFFSIDINGHAFTSSTNDESSPTKSGPHESAATSPHASVNSEDGTTDMNFSRKSSVSGGGLLMRSNSRKRPSSDDQTLSRSNSRLMNRSTSSTSLEEQPAGSTTPSAVQENEDSSGDAKTELRRVLSNRSIARPRARSLRQQQQPILQKAATISSHTSPVGPTVVQIPSGFDYARWSAGVPASVQHLPHSTRCMCGVNTVRGFMVQWYILFYHFYTCITD